MQDEPFDETFIAALQVKTSKYFKRKANIKSKEEFNTFLKEIGLGDIWDSDEEKAAIWDLLIDYKNSDNLIDYNSAIKALNDGLSLQEEEDDETKGDIFKESEDNIPLKINKLRSQKRHVTEIFCQLDISKIIQLKKGFILLELRDKPEITLSEIKELLGKHNFILLTIEEVICFIKEIGFEFQSDKEDKEEKIYIDEEYYQRASRAIESKVTAYTQAQEKKTLSEYVIGSSNNNGESNDPNVINNIMDLIQDITSREKDSIDYTSILKEMKTTVGDLSNNFFLILEKFKNKVTKNDNAVLAKSKKSFINKLDQYENNANEIRKFSQGNMKQLDALKEYCLKFDNNVTLLKEEITQGYQKYHSNQKMEMDNEMERLGDENIILIRCKEEKDLKIKQLEKESSENEKTIHEFKLKTEELEKDKQALQQENEKGYGEKDLLKQEYNTTLDKIGEKINEDKKHKKEKEKIRKSFSLNISNLDELGFNAIRKESCNKDDSPSESTNEELLLKDNHNLSLLSYEKLLSHSIKLDMDYQQLLVDNTSKTEKIKLLEKELSEIKDSYKKDLISMAAGNNENIHGENKICELGKDVEINNKFRPTNMINNTKRNNIHQLQQGRSHSPNETNDTNIMNLGHKSSNNTMKNKSDYKDFLKNKLRVASLEKKQKLQSNGNQVNEDRLILNINSDQENAEANTTETPIKITKENNTDNDNQTVDSIGHGNDFDDRIDDNESKKEIEDNEEEKKEKDQKYNLDKDFDFYQLRKLSNSISASTSNRNGIDYGEIGEVFDKTFSKDGGLLNNHVSLPMPGQREQTSNTCINGKNNENDVNLFSKSSFFKRGYSFPPCENIDGDSFDKKSLDARVSIPEPKTGRQFSSSELNNCMFGKEETENNHKKTLSQSNILRYKYETKLIEEHDGLNPLGETKRIKEDHVNEAQFINLNDFENNKNVIKNAVISTKLSPQKQFGNCKSGKPPQNCGNFLNHSVIIKEEDEDEEKLNKTVYNNNWTSDKNLINKISPIDLSDNLNSSFNNISLDHSRGRSISYFNMKPHVKNNYDFLSLQASPLVHNILKSKNDELGSEDIYTDRVSKIVDSKSIKYNIIITPNGLYLISLKNFSGAEYYSKDQLAKVTIPYKNYNFISIHINGGNNDLLISSSRRLKMLEYLKEYYRENKSKILKFQFLNSFSFNINGKLTEIKINQINDAEMNLDGAKKFGNLYKLRGGLFNTSFDEYGVVFTGIGLLVFEKLNKPPIYLIPVIGSSITIVGGTKYSRQYLFQIKSVNNQCDIFSTNSKEELDSWFKTGLNAQVKYDNKLMKLDKANKMK